MQCTADVEESCIASFHQTCTKVVIVKIIKVHKINEKLYVC